MRARIRGFIRSKRNLRILAFLLVLFLVVFVVLNRDKPWTGFTNYTHTTQVEIFIFLLVCVLVVFVVLNRDKPWTGFTSYTHAIHEGEVFQRGPTLWEWMKLLIVPAILAFGVIWLNSQARQSESKIASDRNQEAALQAYLDRMTDLLLQGKLRDSEPEDEVRTVARTRTLTVLRGLEKERKTAVVWFLVEANLVSADPQPREGLGPIVSLSRADLRGADLRLADLSGADLSMADLSGADLTWADLGGADLNHADLGGADLTWADLRGADLFMADPSGADLSGADLSGANLNVADLGGADLGGADLRGAILRLADLSGANLTGAYLHEAIVTPEQLRSASSLDGATMPDGTKYKPGSLEAKPSAPETTAPGTLSGQESPAGDAQTGSE